jgi:hypothetical protein
MCVPECADDTYTGVGQELQERAERIDAIHRAETRDKPPAAAAAAGDDEDEAAAAPAVAPLPAADSVAALRRRYQLAATISAPAESPAPVCWQRLRMGNALRAQEGHSAALLDDRWMIVVGGTYGHL